MQPYSKNYIDSVNIKNYLNENFIKTGLDSRIKNFKDASFMVDYDDMIGVRALDHYMCKIIMDNGPIDYNLRLYLYKIKVALEDNPFLFYSLPISKVDINQLRKYIPEIDEYVSLIKNKGNEVYNIYLKFDKNPDSLTMEEKIRLVEYFYYRVDTDDKGVRVCLDKFIRYLLNKGMRIGYQTLSLIIKYFGYQKCIEDGLKDTEIIIADMSKYEKKYNKEVFGFSMGNNVVLSKKRMTITTFRDNKLEEKFGRTDKYTEGLAYLATLFHELRHQRQQYECNNNVISSISYYYAARVMIELVNPGDYRENYLFSEIEKDANFYSWVEVEKVIKNYFPDMNLSETVKNIQRHKYTELVEDLCAGRKKGKKKEIAKTVLIRYLDEFIYKNSKLVLEDYKQFRLFYNDDGSLKKIIDLLMVDMDGDVEDFYFEILAYRFNFGRIKMEDLRHMSLYEMKKIIIRMSNIIHIIYIKLYSIRDYKEGNYSISLIDRNEDVLIGDNIKYYKNAARNLVFVLNKMIEKYPLLANQELNINNYISKINNHLKHINRNRICNMYDSNPIPLLNELGGKRYGYKR